MERRDDRSMEEYARARLEYLSVGRQPLVSGPRRSAAEVDAPEHWLADPALLDELTEAEPGAWQQESSGVKEPAGRAGTIGTEPSTDGSRPRWPLAGAEAGELPARALAFGRAHLQAVAVALLALGLVAAVFLMRARASSIPITAVPAAGATGQPGSAGSAPVGGPSSSTVGGVSTSPSPSAPVSASPLPLRVHVLGAVRRPGVVQVPAGGRVADAIAAAGGLGATAAPGELNLAAPIADGDQVIIGVRGDPRGEVRHPGQGATGPQTPGIATGTNPGAASAPGGTTPATALVDLNTATAEQLDGLPGVGPVTAQHILDWRSQHGRFTRVEELQEVDGIGPKTFANLASHVRV